jgi:hypothetical protein
MNMYMLLTHHALETHDIKSNNLTSSPEDLSNSNFDSTAYEALKALAPEILPSSYVRPPTTRSKLNGLFEYGLRI